MVLNYYPPYRGKPKPRPMGVDSLLVTHFVISCLVRKEWEVMTTHEIDLSELQTRLVTEGDLNIMVQLQDMISDFSRNH